MTLILFANALQLHPLGGGGVRSGPSVPFMANFYFVKCFNFFLQCSLFFHICLEPVSSCHKLLLSAIIIIIVTIVIIVINAFILSMQFVQI